MPFRCDKDTKKQKEVMKGHKETGNSGDKYTRAKIHHPPTQSNEEASKEIMRTKIPLSKSTGTSR